MTSRRIIALLAALLVGCATPEVIAPTLAAAIGLYPNPASDELMLELPDHFEGATRIQCFSQTGKMMFSRTFEAEPGANTLALDVRPLADGLYFLQILHESTGETAALKFTMSK